LRRHAKRYRRRSWPGKRSGRSPLSSRSRAVWALQERQRAKAAEGWAAGSSHAWDGQPGVGGVVVGEAYGSAAEVADGVVGGVCGGVAEEDVCFGVGGVVERGVAIVVGHWGGGDISVCGWSSLDFWW